MTIEEYCSKLHKIDKEFLENNLFEQDTIGAGSFPWRYIDKDCVIVVDYSPCGSSPCIFACNYKTGENVQFAREHIRIIFQEDFKRIMEFLDINLDFKYNF